MAATVYERDNCSPEPYDFWCSWIMESFRFEDDREDADEYGIYNLKFLHVFSKNIQPGKIHCIIFHLKNS